MIESPKQIELNHVFLVTNGIKTGKFIVFDQDQLVHFQVNSIYAESDLGKFFLGRSVDDSIFLLLTGNNVYEGFWIPHSYGIISVEVNKTREKIQFGASQEDVSNRFNGYLDRGFFYLGSDSPGKWLSETLPHFGIESDFFAFITDRPAAWWDWRRSNKNLSEKFLKNMRELKQNMAIDMKLVREKAKMIPLSGVYNSSRKDKRLELVDIAEKLALIAAHNEFDNLTRELEDARKFLSAYILEFGDDFMTEFLNARVSVLQEAFSCGLDQGRQ